MKLLHTADLHIGKTFNGASLLDDQRLILEQILALADAEDVDALLIAGDVYDKFTPSAEAVRLLSWFLTRAADQGLHVVAIPGNHDSAERIGYAAELLEGRNIHLAGPYEGSIKKVELRGKTTEDGQEDRVPVVLWLFPFVKPVHVRPYFPDEEIGTDYTAALAHMVASCDLDPHACNIALVHQFLLGGLPNTVANGEGQRGKVHSGGADTEGAEQAESIEHPEPAEGAKRTGCDERSEYTESIECAPSALRIGGLGAVDPRVFSVFDYVAAGHIHRPQTVAQGTAPYGSDLKGQTRGGLEESPEDTGRGVVRYAGSPLAYSFSESIASKTVTVIEIDDQGHIELSERDLKPLHDVRRIRGPLDQLCSAEVVDASPADDYLEITLTDELVPLGALAKLRSVYPHVLVVRHEPERTADVDDGKDNAYPWGGREVDYLDADLSSLELFEHFYEQQTGTSLSNDQRQTALHALEAAFEGER